MSQPGDSYECPIVIGEPGDSPFDPIVVEDDHWLFDLDFTFAFEKVELPFEK